MAGILKVDQVQSDSNLSFQVAGANVAYMNSTGLQMTGGQIIAGSNTLLTASGLIYANAGIAFPATQVSSADANTLDDYEEGTWTPNFGGNTTYTSNQFGIYTKIGNLATCHFDVSVSSIGTGDGSVLRGFPFTSGNAMPQGGTITYYQSSSISTISFLCYMVGNVAYAYFVGNSSSAATSQNNGSVFVTSGTRVAGVISYRTT